MDCLEDFGVKYVKSNELALWDLNKMKKSEKKKFTRKKKKKNRNIRKCKKFQEK